MQCQLQSVIAVAEEQGPAAARPRGLALAAPPARLTIAPGQSGSGSFREQVEKAIAAVPSGAQRRLREAGVTIHIGDRLTAALPELRERPIPTALQRLGITDWNMVPGVYVEELRSFAVAERILKPGGSVPYPLVEPTVRHELGHALNHVLGVSAWDSFRNAYARGLQRALRLQLHDRLGYYLAVEVGTREVFAESFAILTGGGADPSAEAAFRQAFVEVLSAVRSILRRL